jgi:hypothetical protein
LLPAVRSTPPRRPLLDALALEARVVPAITLSVTGYPSPVTAGTAGSVTVEALDSTTNQVVTNYAGTIHFTSTDFLAVLPADYTFVPQQDAGSHTFPSVTLKVAGTQSISAADTGPAAIRGSETGIVVNPGPTTRLGVSLPGDPAAGTAFSLSVSALDAYGNRTPGYTGTVAFSSSDPRASLPAAYPFTAADQGVHAFTNGATLYAAGRQSVTATDTGPAGYTGTSFLTIKVGPARSIGLTLPAAVAQGSPFGATVTAYDSYGNPGATYFDTVHFSSSDGTATLPANYTFNPSDFGVHTFSVTLNTLSTQTVTVTDATTANILPTSAQTTVNPEPGGLHFAISTSVTETTAGAPFTVTVTALDGGNNVAAAYTGSVHFTSTDTASRRVLPADYTFTAADAGVHTFTNGFTLVTAANQMITATDLGVGTGSAASAAVQIDPGPFLQPRVAGFPSPITAGVSGSFTVSAQDSYGNVVPSYAGTIHFTSSDAQAVLPPDYTFIPSDAGVHTFSATLKTASTVAYIQATDPVARTFGSQNVINVTPAAAASLIVSPYQPTVTAGATGTVINVTALDPYGNTATGYLGTIHFTSSDAQATLPGDYTFTTADKGFHQFFSGTIFRTAGRQTITGTDTATASVTGTGAINVNPAAASVLALVAPSASTAGATFLVTVRAQDAYGNVVPSYTGTVHFASSDGRAALPADYTFTSNDAGSHTFFPNGVTLFTAGSQSVTVTASGMTAASGTVMVSPGAAASLSLAAPATATAGTGITVTLTARDAYGNTATGYAGTVHFRSTDGQAVLPGDYPFTAGDAGVHSFGATLKTAGNQSLTATDGTLSASAAVAVNAAAASSLRVTAPAAATAGAAFDVTVTALDPYQNVATGYAGKIHFTSSDSRPTLPADYTFTAGDAGTHTFAAGATLDTAGTQTVTATDPASGSLTDTASVAVSPAAASSLRLTTPSTSTAGAAFDVTVTAFDPFGNTAAGYAGTVHFASSDGQASLPGNYTFLGSDAGTHTFVGGVTLFTSGNQSVSVSAAGVSAGSGTVAVSPAAAATLTLAAPGSTTAGSAFTATLTARDAYGNVATGYTGTVHFTSTDGQASLPADYTFGAADAGMHSFGVTLETSGSQSVSASDGSLTGSASVAVSAAAASTLQVSAPAGSTAGAAFGVTVTALDVYHNVASGYLGTVHFSSSDGQATLPADYTFTAGDAGRHTFAGDVTLDTAGTQTVTATDAASASLTGTAAVAVSPAAASHLGVAAPSISTAGTAFSVTVTALDPFGNTASGYLGTVHFSSSDGQATLPADYGFTSGDGGSHSFGVTLKTAGTQSVTASDTLSAGIAGTAAVAVSPAAASALQVVNYPAATTAGAAHPFQVIARDPYGNVATGYSGSVHFSSSDGQAVLPADSTVSGGNASFTATLKTAGGQSITATDAANALSGSETGITVTPAAAAVLRVSAPAATTAGGSFTFTVTALDAFGNPATGYGGTVHFSSSDGQAALPGNGTLTNGSGSFIATLKTAGNQSLTATDTANGSLTGSAAVSVSAAAASTLVLAGYPSPTTAGTGRTFTVTARDAYGNLATGYTGTVHFSSSDAQAGLPADYAFTTADAGTHTFTAMLKTAGSQSLSVRDAANLSGTQAGITVNAAAVASLAVTGYPATTTAGTAHTFTVTARDAYGNVVTGYTGTVNFMSSDAQAGLPAAYTFTAADAGTHTFTATLKTAGSQSLTATDAATAAITGSQAGITVTPAAATHLQIIAPTSVKARTSFTITVVALDAYGNVATGYRGSVHFTSSDHKAVLPPDYTFVAGDNGKHTFTMSLNGGGTQTVTVTDKANGSIKGSATVIVA